MKKGIELIAEERDRQIASEGYDAAHDDEHTQGQIATAAACYALLGANQSRYDFDFPASEMYVPHTQTKLDWMWSDDSWKPNDDPIRNLIKAGALIAAEIDRLQRKAEKN